MIRFVEQIWIKRQLKLTEVFEASGRDGMHVRNSYAMKRARKLDTCLREDARENLLVRLCYCMISLPLLVSGILLADDIHTTLSSDDLERAIRSRVGGQRNLPGSTHRAS